MGDEKDSEALRQIGGEGGRGVHLLLKRDYEYYKEAEREEGKPKIEE